jgi:hypothetical protein
MSTSNSIFAYVSGVPEIASLVADRIFPGAAPAGTVMPFINVQRITNHQETAHDGDQGLGAALYQFSAWSTSFDEVDMIRQALLRLNGTTVEVDGVGDLTFLHSNDGEGYDEETREFSVRVEFTVWH